MERYTHRLFGHRQDTVVVTPISMLRAVASVGVQGRMYTPHFVKEFKPISAVGTEGETGFFPAREGFGFQHPEPKIVEMTTQQNDLVVKGMWGVVNGGGTGAGIRIPGFEIAGKTWNCPGCRTRPGRRSKKRPRLVRQFRSGL